MEEPQPTDAAEQPVNKRMKKEMTEDEIKRMLSHLVLDAVTVEGTLVLNRGTVARRAFILSATQQRFRGLGRGYTNKKLFKKEIPRNGFNCLIAFFT